MCIHLLQNKHLPINIFIQLILKALGKLIVIRNTNSDIVLALCVILKVTIVSVFAKFRTVHPGSFFLTLSGQCLSTIKLMSIWVVYKSRCKLFVKDTMYNEQQLGHNFHLGILLQSTNYGVIFLKVYEF